MTKLVLVLLMILQHLLKCAWKVASVRRDQPFMMENVYRDRNARALFIKKLTSLVNKCQMIVIHGKSN